MGSNEDGKKRAARIDIMEDGPYRVSGGVPLDREAIASDEEGTSVEWEKEGDYPEQETYTLCRCGGSKGKPYCDGTHVGIGFDGTETADHGAYMDRADTLEGMRLRLTDDGTLCAIARFCHAKGGAWGLAQRAYTDQQVKDAIEVVGNCPTGRLVVWDKKTGEALEPKLDQAITVSEYPMEHASGPLLVKGGIPVFSSNGEAYEVRNRQALCRCGASGNKPFCDGAHLQIRFNDGDESVERKRVKLRKAQ